jgi:hypothetical protein
MTHVDDVPETDGTPGPGRRAGLAARGALGLVGSVVRFVTSLFAAVLLLQMVLLLFGANPFNTVTVIVAALANSLTLGLATLFLFANPIAQVVVSYGLPAIAWVIIGSVIVAVLRAIARPSSGLR